MVDAIDFGYEILSSMKWGAVDIFSIIQFYTFP
jgi:hypothetical protein